MDEDGGASAAAAAATAAAVALGDASDPLRAGSIALACRIGRHEAIAPLLHAGADPAVCDNRNWSPLHEAAFAGHAHCIDTLCRACPTLLDVEARSHEGRTPLMVACSRANVQCALALLRAGADPNAASLDENRCHLLVCGLDVSRAADAAALLNVLAARRCRLRDVYFSGSSALHECAWRGNAAMLRRVLYLDRCQRHNVTIDTADVADVRVERLRMDEESVRWLFDRDSNGLTCLYVACQNGFYECAELILELAGESHRTRLANTASNEDASCLYVSAEQGHTDIVRLLLSVGADADLSHVVDIHPLRLRLHPVAVAVTTADVELVRMLVDKSSAAAIGESARDPVFRLVDKLAGRSASVHAAADMLDALVAKGCAVDTAGCAETSTITVPAYAAHLLRRHYDNDAQKTPLGVLSQRGPASPAKAAVHWRMVVALAAAGARVHSTEPGAGVASPLSLAILHCGKYRLDLAAVRQSLRHDRRLRDLNGVSAPQTFAVGNVEAECNVPDAVLAALAVFHIRPDVMAMLLELGTEPRLPLWCDCARVSSAGASSVGRRRCGTAACLHSLPHYLSTVAQRESLLRLLVAALSGGRSAVPRCCDLWRHFADGGPLPAVRTLQSHCATVVRDAVPFAARLHGDWADRLGLPPHAHTVKGVLTLRAYLR